MNDEPLRAEARPRRTFVLDTNVLLYDPNALTVFQDNDLVIPITVIEEIDRFKKDLNETGRNARWVSRRLDALRERGQRSLAQGVRLPEGGTLRVTMSGGEASLPSGFGGDTSDNRILRTVMGLRDQAADPSAVVLVTRDTNMRIKADTLGVCAEDYEHCHIDVSEVYTGILEQDEDGGRISALYAAGALEPTEAQQARLHPNQFLVLRNPEQPSHSALARYDGGVLRLLGRRKEGVWGVMPRNKEQLFALELLLDDRVQVVTLSGMAGTGKTLLAIAAGLKCAVEDGRYRRMLVSRPIFPLGRDIGFLPGDLSEKLNPWMKPIFDNLEFLFGGADSEDDDDVTRPRRGGPAGPQVSSYQYLLDRGVLQVEPLTYIRGRSLPRQFFLVDEAQNLTPHEVKTVISRAGEGTKIVLTGDPYQIDNPYVDATSNGLSHVIERFKGSPIAGHVTLTKGERSELSELASRLL